MAHISSISSGVINTIAEYEGTDPVDMNPPLYEAIDLETVDRVFSSTSGHFHLEFTYDSYLITVENPGHVEITAQQPSETASETPIASFSVE